MASIVRNKIMAFLFTKKQNSICIALLVQVGWRPSPSPKWYTLQFLI